MKFSIITPSLNQAAYIKENIQSVLAQEYPDIEHIIVDGGSADGTIDILRKYPHLRWISEPDQGQASAVNRGLRMATGELVGWLNADDTYCPNILALVARSFLDPAAMVVYGDAFEIDEHSDVVRTREARGISAEQLIKYWMWNYQYTQPAFFFRRSVFNDAGFLDEQLHHVMDHEFFIRLSLRYPLEHIPSKLANYRLHSASKTGRADQRVLPDSIWELHRVSKRYWGNTGEAKYYRYLLSFVGGIVMSLTKNIFFVRGSRSRLMAKRVLIRVSSMVRV